jgi:hypothetical protein
MRNTLLINSKEYAISVTVYAGEGDGTLIYRDASGHFHHIGPDPGPLQEKITAAIKNIEAGVHQFQASIGQIKGH